MKNIYGLLLAAMLVFSAFALGCVQEPIPEKVLEKYEEVKKDAVPGNEFPETLQVCTKGNNSIYMISSDAEVDGPVLYIDEDGNVIATGGYSGNLDGLPDDFSDYQCTELKKEYA